MSKSIMIVICDFLLLSLLSLANFDSPQKEKATEESEKLALQTQSFADSQMLDLLKMSLDSERDRRTSMDADVEKLARIAEENKKLAERQRKILNARDAELKSLAKTKTDLESEREQILKKSDELQTRVNAAEQRNVKLQSEILSASAKLEKSANERVALERKIGDMRQIDSASRAKLELVQNELRQNKIKLEALQSESESLKIENKAIENEKRALATRLEVASTKTKIYEENIKRYQALVDIEKSEKEKIREHAETLAIGVGQLAAKQTEIKKSVAELRPKTATEIFESIKSKFLKVTFSHSSKGLFSDGISTNDLRVLPVEIAGKVWLIIDASETIVAPTPHQYYAPDMLSVSIFGNTHKFSPNAIYSIAEDPRFLVVEAPEDFVKKENLKPLSRPQNFFTHSDCIVVNPKKFRYGQSPFRADFKNDSYAKLDVGLIESVFGEFSPTQGDAVMTRDGYCIGTMVNSSVALIFKTLTPNAILWLGEKYSKPQAAAFVKKNSEHLKALPLSLK